MIATGQYPAGKRTSYLLKLSNDGLSDLCLILNNMLSHPEEALAAGTTPEELAVLEAVGSTIVPVDTRHLWTFVKSRSIHTLGKWPKFTKQVRPPRTGHAAAGRAYTCVYPCCQRVAHIAAGRHVYFYPSHVCLWTQASLPPHAQQEHPTTCRFQCVVTKLTE